MNIANELILMITQPQFFKQKMPTCQQVIKLQSLKEQILLKIQEIDQLNQEYKQKNQRSFLCAFMKIMQQLSEQLKNSIQLYQNIDEEIKKDQKCILLSKQLQFFQSQGELMQRTYTNQLQKLSKLKQKNRELKYRKIQQRKKSVHSCQKYHYYSIKNKTNSFKNKLFKQQRTSQCDLKLESQISCKKRTQSTKLGTSTYAQITNYAPYNKNNKDFLIEKYKTEKKDKLRRNTIVFTAVNKNRFNHNSQKKIHQSHHM